MDWLEEYNKTLETEWKPTTLDEKEEPKFREWLQNTQLFNSFKQDVAAENNIPIDQVDNARLVEMVLSSGDYDYRGAYKGKVSEEISPFDNRIHWPSVSPDGKLLKSPQHPTTWKEFFMRQYKVDPDELGLTTLEQAKAFKPTSDFEDILSNPLMEDTTK